MYSVVIIDDEIQARKALKQMLSDFCKNVEVIGEAEGVETGVQLLNNLKPDFIFLDIMMQDGSGFNLLDKIPDREFKVIFTTAYDNYAIKAFKYSAIDYLLKPINPVELIETISKLDNIKPINKEQLDLVTEKSLDKIALPGSHGVNFVKIEDIIRCKSDNSYTTFYFTNGERQVVSRSIGEWEKLLPNDQFMRTHQSHLVNMNCIKMYNNKNGTSLITSDDAEVPVSRAKKDELKSRLGL